MNAEALKEVPPMLWDADWVVSVAVVPNSTRVVAGNNRGEMLGWDVPAAVPAAAPVPVVKYAGHANVVTRLICTRDGKRLFSSSNDHTVHVWEPTAAAKPGASVTLNPRAVERAAARKGSRPVKPVTAEVGTVSPVATIKAHRDWVTAMALSADESLLATGDDSGNVVVHDAKTLKPVATWKTAGWVYALAISPDNARVAVTERLPLVFDSGRRDGASIRELKTGKVVHDLSAAFKSQYLACAAFSPDGKTLALGRGGECDGMNGVVSLVDVASGKKTQTFSPGHLNGMTDLAYVAGGKMIATSGRDTTVVIRDAAGGKVVRTLGKPRGGQFKDWYAAVSVSGDGKRVAAADIAGGVQVWVG